jgi:hypothetical protein
MSIDAEIPGRPRPVRVFRLGAEPLDDLSERSTAAERFEMVAMLSARMLEFSRTPPRTSGNREIPVRIIRL